MKFKLLVLFQKIGHLEIDLRRADGEIRVYIAFTAAPVMHKGTRSMIYCGIQKEWQGDFVLNHRGPDGFLVVSSSVWAWRKFFHFLHLFILVRNRESPCICRGLTRGSITQKMEERECWHCNPHFTLCMLGSIVRVLTS